MQASKIKPKQDRVLVKVLKPQKRGLIEIPNMEQNYLTGEVLEVGEGKQGNTEWVEVRCKKGEKVLFHHSVGHQFKEGDDEYRLVKADDVLAEVE